MTAASRHGRPRGRRRRRRGGAASSIAIVVLPLLVLAGGGSAAAASSAPTDDVPGPEPVEHVVRDPSQKEREWKEEAAAAAEAQRQSQRGGASDGVSTTGGGEGAAADDGGGGPKCPDTGFDPLPDVHCGWGGGPCPDGYGCVIDLADGYAICCPEEEEEGGAEPPKSSASEPRSIVTHVYDFCVRYPDAVPLDAMLDEISRDVSEALKESFGNEGLAERRNALEEEHLKIFSVESLASRGENAKCDCNAPGEAGADAALSCEAVESTTLVTHETDASDGEVHYVLTLHARDISERFKYQSTYVGPLAASSRATLTLVGVPGNTAIDGKLRETLERALEEFFVDDFLSLDADGLQVLHVEVQERRRGRMRSFRSRHLERRRHSVRANRRRADGDGDSTAFSSDVPIALFCEHVPSRADDVDDFLMGSIGDELEQLVDHLRSSGDPFLSAVTAVRVSDGASPAAQSPHAAPSTDVAPAESVQDANAQNNDNSAGLGVAIILGVCAAVSAIASFAFWRTRRRLLDSDLDMDPCADDIYVVGGKQRKAKKQPPPTDDVSINTNPSPARDGSKFGFAPAKLGGINERNSTGRRSGTSAELVKRLSGVFAGKERERETECDTADDAAGMRNVNLYGNFKSVRHIRPTMDDDEIAGITPRAPNPTLGQGIATVEEWRKLRKSEAKKKERRSFLGLGGRSGDGSSSSASKGVVWVDAKDVDCGGDGGRGKNRPAGDAREDPYDSDDSASAVILSRDKNDDDGGGGESQDDDGRKRVGWQCQPSSSSERTTSDDRREREKPDGEETKEAPMPETDQARNVDSGEDDGTGIDGVPLPVRSID